MEGVDVLKQLVDKLGSTVSMSCLDQDEYPALPEWG